MLGGFDPGNAFVVIDAPELAADLLKVQLVAVAVLFLIGFVVMVTCGVAGRPLPTPIKVLVSFFSLAFVLGAVLLLSLALEIPLDAFLTIQRTMFVVVGAAPFVFLLAILDARLARSAVGDLLVELRSSRRPPTCASRCPVRCATHGQPRLLATAVRRVGRPGRATGQPAPSRRRPLGHPDRQRRRTSGGPCPRPLARR